MRSGNVTHKRILLGGVLGAVLLGALLVIFSSVHVGSPKVSQAPKPGPTLPAHQTPTPPPPPPQLPAGGRTLLPDRRLVALYGIPNDPALGALGEQSLDASIQRIKTLASEYQTYSDIQILPTFEIITTIAAGSPTENGDYSLESDPTTIEPMIDAASKAGIYTLLDLQPGRSDFLTQAKEYERLLSRPGVGLALDPEWRLGPNEEPLQQIGSVSAGEINTVSQWLADLTAKHDLPQKLFMIHQFRTDMISGRGTLDTTHDSLAYVIQMDGKGAQSQKLSTWSTIQADAPKNLRFGWKNFYDEDSPMLTPEQTMNLSPKPWYVSYQ